MAAVNSNAETKRWNLERDHVSAPRATGLGHTSIPDRPCRLPRAATRVLRDDKNIPIAPMVLCATSQRLEPTTIAKYESTYFHYIQKNISKIEKIFLTVD